MQIEEIDRKIKEINERITETMNNARAAERDHAAATKEYRSIPLWRRIFNRRRYAELRDRIDTYHWDRFKWTSIGLALFRQKKRLSNIRRARVGK